MGVGSALEAFPGVFETPRFCSDGRPGDRQIISWATPPLHILHPIQRAHAKGYPRNPRAPAVIHAAAQHGFAITALRPALNLRKLAFGEGEYRGPLQPGQEGGTPNRVTCPSTQALTYGAGELFYRNRLKFNLCLGIS